MFRKLRKECFENTKFNKKDDAKLLNMVQQFGKKWKLITKYFSGKSLN